MSGSSKKKLRKEQSAAALTEKQKQAQKEAKTLKAYTTTFVVVMALVVAMLVGIVLRSPVEGLINRNTHAVTIGNHELTIPEFSYFFVDEINDYYLELYNYYGSYATYFMGFSTGKSLNDQVYDSTTGKTWAKYFMEQAAESAQTIYGLYDLAIQEGHELTEEEAESLKSQTSTLKEEAKSSGYASVNSYLKAIYGNGSTLETYENYTAVAALASSYYYKHSDELEASYTDETFRKYEEDKIGEYYSYDYFLYQIDVEDYLGEGTKDEDGEVTYTDEEMAAALAAAKADVEILLEAGIIDEATFNAALLNIQKTTETEDDSTEATEATQATESTDSTEATEGTDEEEEEEAADVPLCTVGDAVLYSSLPSVTLQDWVKSEDAVTGKVTSVEIKTEKEHTHEEGEEHSDDEEVEYETTGFYVILLTNVDQNDMKLVNVRHILIEAEGITDSSTTEETEAANSAAIEKAEDLLKQWKDGEQTAESFAALAEEHSTDTGSNTNGGLYEDVYPGYMVEEFNDWCFDAERKVGDSAVVETEYGYHVMYLDSFGEYSFRDFMIMNDKLTDDLTAYIEEIIEATPYTEVDLSRMNWDITFG